MILVDRSAKGITTRLSSHLLPVLVLAPINPTDSPRERKRNIVGRRRRTEPTGHRVDDAVEHVLGGEPLLLLGGGFELAGAVDGDAAPDEHHGDAEEGDGLLGALAAVRHHWDVELVVEGFDGLREKNILATLIVDASWARLYQKQITISLNCTSERGECETATKIIVASLLVGSLGNEF